MYGNKYSDQLLPLLTPEMLTRYPDQTCDILNKLIRLAQKSSTSVVSGGGEGNLEDIVQTTTSYADGGVNVVTAYLSDGTTQDFQIRNGHQGSQGDPGTPGTPGADGQDATIAVGTTTTLPAGSNATVTDSGTPSAAVLNFGIPRGADGQNGQDGQDGQDGFSPIATVSKSGDTATITITDENGTTTATVTDGSDGAPGQAATVAAGTTTTLPAGSSASVTNSGTSSAAIFDFSIPKGDTGAAGQDGADGADGFSPIATVSKSGDTATITITDENGTTTATVTDGTNGAPGAAATITAGTTTTLSPGSSATVTNSGTSSAAIFDFGIPQGATGAPGADGAAATIAVGTTTTLPAGSSATVSNSGTSSAAVFNFGIPKGDTGSAGAAATVAAGTVTTLAPGSNATVTNSGTSSAAIFDFGIPQGATGATGPANTLSIGTVQSGATADATITGTAPNQTLNLTLPKGDTGQQGVKGDPGKGCPIGTILPFGGDLIPEGYLVCDGSAVSRTTYADLFDVIGTRYGAGDGSTTFNLPNLSGRVAVGQDLNDADFDTLGDNGGEKAHTLITNEMPSHSHLRGNGNGARGDTASPHSGSGGYLWHYDSNGRTDSEGGNQPHNNLQPYLVTAYIIKFKDLPATVAEVKDSYSSSSTDVYSASYINNALNNTNDILNLIYPVGSIYMSVNNVSPANFIGGQWERIQDQFLMSAGTNYAAGTSGGNATHQHTLSNAGWAKGAVISGIWKYHEISVPAYNVTWQLSGSGGSASGNSTYGTGLGGKTDNTTNLPPYLAVYVWKRTA